MNGLMNPYVLRRKKTVLYGGVYLNSLYLDRIFLKMIDELKIQYNLNKMNFNVYHPVLNYYYYFST